MDQWHEGYFEGLMGYKWGSELLARYPHWTGQAYEGWLIGWRDRRKAHRELGLEITGTSS